MKTGRRNYKETRSPGKERLHRCGKVLKKYTLPYLVSWLPYKFYKESMKAGRGASRFDKILEDDLTGSGLLRMTTESCDKGGAVDYLIS